LTAQADVAGAADATAPRVQYTEYGWSPRWGPAQAARRIFDFLEATALQWRPRLQPPQVSPDPCLLSRPAPHCAPSHASCPLPKLTCQEEISFGAGVLQCQNRVLLQSQPFVRIPCETVQVK